MVEENRSKYMRQEYISRINRVMDFIEENISEELNLDKVAGVANFSPYHFHRIFRSMTGETLNRFIQRVRMEKAAGKLTESMKRSVSEVAYDMGFNSPAAFTRAFGEMFGLSPSDFREAVLNGDKSKIGKVKSKLRKALGNIGKEYYVSSSYFDPVNNSQKWKVKSMKKEETKIEVKEVPEMTVAYIRHIGPYQGDGALFEKLFTKLFTWAGARNLIRFPETKTMTFYHDNPELTDDDKLRISVSISVPDDTEVDGEFGKMKVAGGKYAVGHFELTEDEYGEAWELMMRGWLPESGFQPDDRLCFESYMNDPNQHPEKKHLVDIYIPVKPL